MLGDIVFLLIQMLSKIEMPMQDAHEHIVKYFPALDMDVTSNHETGVVRIKLSQDELTEKQRAWLANGTFAACYIDFYVTIAEQAKVLCGCCDEEVVIEQAELVGSEESGPLFWCEVCLNYWNNSVA